VEKGEIPMGIISGAPGFVGGVYKEWPKKYLRDEFGGMIVEDYQEEEMIVKTEKMTREWQKIETRTSKEEVTQTKIVLEGGKYIQKQVTETVTRDVE
jgi:hypothetical protein